MAEQTPQQVADHALRRFQQLTEYATQAADRRMVLPHDERAWRSEQDGLMQLAQAAALVSIAGSLARLAWREPGQRQDLAARLREVLRRRAPGDQVPAEELMDLLGGRPAAACSGEVSGG